jgi:hypothetical protein
MKKSVLTRSKIVLLRKNNPCMNQEEIGRRVRLTAARVGQILRSEGMQPKHYIPVIKCQNCGKEKFRGKYFHNSKFCSYKCYSEYRSKIHKIKVECTQCGRIFDRNISEVLSYPSCIKHGHKGRMFCSRKCFGAYAGKYYGFGRKGG